MILSKMLLPTPLGPTTKDICEAEKLAFTWLRSVRRPAVTVKSHNRISVGAAGESVTFVVSRECETDSQRWNRLASKATNHLLLIVCSVPSRRKANAKPTSVGL